MSHEWEYRIKGEPLGTRVVSNVTAGASDRAWFSYHHGRRGYGLRNETRDRIIREMIADGNEHVAGEEIRVVGAVPEPGTPPPDGMQVPTDEQLQELGTFDPTGTKLDAFTAREAVRELVSTDDAVAACLEQIRQVPPDPIPDHVMAQIYQSWCMSVMDDATVVYVDAELADQIWESAKTLPEVYSVHDLQLPDDGIVLLGSAQAMSDGGGQRDTTMGIQYPNWDGPPMAALTWNLMDSDTGDRSLLQVTPWGTSAARAASYVWGDVPRIDHRVLAAGDLFGPLLPDCPVWMDGNAPRRKSETEDEADDSWWSDRVNAPLRFMAALALWMQQKITVTEDELLPRADRRRYERSNKGSTAPKIRSVKLRAIERGDRELTGGESGREYSCRWFVKTHWRKPWVKHPVTGERYQRPVLVHRYLAGPDDKPIKAPVATVWNVDR
jgi:hypothetical protein